MHAIQSHCTLFLHARKGGMGREVETPFMGPRLRAGRAGLQATYPAGAPAVRHAGSMLRDSFLDPLCEKLFVYL